MAKPELRKAMRAARRAYVSGLTGAERGSLEASLGGHLRDLVEHADAVGGYHAIGSEIDPAPALALAKLSALPTFDAGDDRFRFRGGPTFEAGPHGIPQPGAHEQLVACSLVLVPLLAVDPRGFRLGQGGGHYDRVLPALREAGATLIGLGWDVQRLDFDLPADPWDVRLDGFASPRGIEMFDG
jgi:5-formyltetrahydrofolate cyclo-ligase